MKSSQAWGISTFAVIIAVFASCLPPARAEVWTGPERIWIRTDDGLLLRGSANLDWHEQVRQSIGMPDVRRHSTGVIRLTRIDRRTAPASAIIIEIVDRGEDRLLVREVGLSQRSGEVWSVDHDQRKEIIGRFENLSRVLVRMLVSGDDIARTEPGPDELRVCDHPPPVLIDVKIEGELPIILSRHANCREDDPVRNARKQIERLAADAF